MNTTTTSYRRSFNKLIDSDTSQTTLGLEPKQLNKPNGTQEACAFALAESDEACSANRIFPSKTQVAKVDCLAQGRQIVLTLIVVLALAAAGCGASSSPRSGGSDGVGVGITIPVVISAEIVREIIEALGGCMG